MFDSRLVIESLFALIVRGEYTECAQSVCVLTTWNCSRIRFYFSVVFSMEHADFNMHIVYCLRLVYAGSIEADGGSLSLFCCGK